MKRRKLNYWKGLVSRRNNYKRNHPNAGKVSVVSALEQKFPERTQMIMERLMREDDGKP